MKNNNSEEDFKKDLTFRDFFEDEIIEINLVLENGKSKSGKCKVNLEFLCKTTEDSQKIFKFFDFA